MSLSIRQIRPSPPPLNPSQPIEQPPPPALTWLERTPLSRRDFWLERVPESLPRHQLRFITGLIFLVFGLMKSFALPLLVGAPGLQVSTGVEGFARVIEGLGMPFPLLGAWVVVVMEPLCGLGLILSAWTSATRLFTRLSALPLMGIMTGSLMVGLRQVGGHPVILDGFPVMNQPWRLPLELALLLSMIYLVWRPAARSWSNPSAPTSPLPARASPLKAERLRRPRRTSAAPPW